MRAENYIAFFTVCGFFVGLVFTVLRAHDPIDMMLYTIFITFFFYLVIHIIIMNYVDIRQHIKLFFDKDRHEDVADYLLTELAIREKRMENLIIKATEKKSEKSGKDARVKAKAA
ncbi:MULTISPECIES: hypothetical protein [unclassified Campylobacter]|uniref:hypothetical protein n=1 Tax=unclassified Campylobacter TaxID=2593542 RepID=UPI003D3280B8